MIVNHVSHLCENTMSEALNNQNMRKGNMSARKRLVSATNMHMGNAMPMPMRQMMSHKTSHKSMKQSNNSQMRAVRNQVNHDTAEYQDVMTFADASVDQTQQLVSPQMPQQTAQPTQLTSSNDTDVTEDRPTTNHTIIRFIIFAIAAIFALVDYVPISQSVIDAVENAHLYSYGLLNMILSLPDETKLLPYVGVLAIGMLFSKRAMQARRESHIRIQHVVASIILSLLAAFAASFGRYIDATQTDLTPIWHMFDGWAQCLKFALGFASTAIIAFPVLVTLLTSNLHDLIERAVNVDTLRHVSARIVRFAPLIIALAWLPWLIGTFPGNLVWDAANQVAQFFNLPGETTQRSVVLMDPNIIINQHHSVLYTMLIGTGISIGKAVSGGNWYVGIFTVTLVQYGTLILTLWCAFKHMNRHGVNQIVQLVVLVITCVSPIAVNNCVMINKDTGFAIALMAAMLSVDTIMSNGRVRVVDALKLLVSASMAALLRNGMVVPVAGMMIVTVAIVAWRAVRSKKCEYVSEASTSTDGGAFALRDIAILVPAAVASIIVPLVVTYCVYPAFSFTPGSKREMLSVPIQQVALCVERYPDDIASWERDAIDTVLDYDGMVAGYYDPDIADAVKTAWKPGAPADERNAFLSAWWSVVNRHPSDAIEATLRNYYEYMYVNGTETSVFAAEKDNGHGVPDGIMESMGVEEIDDGIVPALRNAYDAYIGIADDVPVLSVLSMSPFWCWLLIVAFVKSMTDGSGLRAATVCMMLVLLVVFMGPCNGYYTRYLVPMVYFMPFVAAMLWFGEDGRRRLEDAAA